MNANDIILLQRSGVLRSVYKNKITQISETSIPYVFYLQKGLMKISAITDDEREIIKYIVKPGQIFGELNLIDNENKNREIAYAMENSELWFVPVDTVKRLMQENESFGQSINKAIGNRINKMEERMFSLMIKTVKERILDFLKDFVAEFGYPVVGGYEAKNFLTHDDIAKIITTSRQTVTTSLIDFRKKGWIDYDSSTLKVYNL